MRRALVTATAVLAFAAPVTNARAASCEQVAQLRFGSPLTLNAVSSTATLVQAYTCVFPSGEVRTSTNAYQLSYSGTCLLATVRYGGWSAQLVAGSVLVETADLGVGAGIDVFVPDVPCAETFATGFGFSVRI
jgi:hypothetical protein